MDDVRVQRVTNPDSVPTPERTGGVSGPGTGGGKSDLDTTHYLKDLGQGGALPDSQQALDAAVEGKHYRNEKALEGTLTLVKGAPGLNGGDKIVVTGVGPQFSGEWIIKTHVLTVSADGCHSSLELTRNALGDNGGKTEIGNTLDTGNSRVSVAALPQSEHGD